MPSATIEHAPERTGRKPLEIHIYNPGSRVALCGHRGRGDVPALPWVRGIYDCPTCWEIHGADG